MDWHPVRRLWWARCSYREICGCSYCKEEDCAGEVSQGGCTSEEEGGKGKVKEGFGRVETPVRIDSIGNPICPTRISVVILTVHQASIKSLIKNATDIQSEKITIIVPFLFSENLKVCYDQIVFYCMNLII